MALLAIKAMLEAIHLDDQLQPMGDKVRIVTANRRLSTKVRSFDRNTPEVPPQPAFLLGHCRAQPSCGLQLEPNKFWHREAPVPPPRRFAATSPIKGEVEGA